MKFKHAYVSEVIIEGMPGDTVYESVDEVFKWFYDQKDVKKVVMPHINGVTVIFEKSRDAQ